MEVVTAAPNRNSPFHNHDVREWARLNRLTGVLERARLESDHWTANTSNGTHKYGKLVDSRARTAANGHQLAQAQRQLEVFQSHHQSGGNTTTSSRLQVIKTQTAVVSSNNSRWSQQQNIARSSSKTTVQSSNSIPSKESDVVNGKKDAVLQGFDSLQLALNPLDLTSQKSKASVGRSVGRRPPSRSRLKEDASTTLTTSAPTTNPASSQLNSTASSAAAAAFRFQATTNLHRVSRLCHQIHDTAVKNTFGNTLLLNEPRVDGDGSVEITEIEPTDKPSLTRTKSTSSEDLHEKTNRSTEDLEDLEQLQNWRRTSKIRRSLQYPNRQQKSASNKPLDLPENKGNVRKIREDLETGRRLSTALRGNNVDLDALEQILQSISSCSSVESDGPERDANLIVAKRTKKSSFVTVESIQDMRSRLRRTSSPDREDTDDGIVTEELRKPSDLIAAMEGSQSRVRSYVYGMESQLGKGKNIAGGTGSLESRTKQLNGNSALRNEDWYSRRKSYGFEQVHDKAEDENSIGSKTRNRVESSTDSGICRSTEIVVVPAATKVSCDNSSESDLDFTLNKQQRKYNSYTKPDRKDAMLELDENPFSSRRATEELASIWNKRASSVGRDIYSPTSDCPAFPMKLRQSDSTWMNSDTERESSSKSMTISDDFKYNISSNKISDDETLASGKKNSKKVEFCKTEVHFVADSGRVNIVETDDKPPPTQNFRRRRRNTGSFNMDELKKGGVPVLRFGDTTYEKTLFGDVETEDPQSNSPDEELYETVQLLHSDPLAATTTTTTTTSSGVVTVNINTPHYDYEEDQKENYENGTPRGILKNKPVKPKPYILGDSIESGKPTKSWINNNVEAPIWRSTVTVRNTFYDKNGTSSDNNDISSDNERSEYGQLLRQPNSLKRNSENFDLLRGRHSPVDLRRSSWSVADRVKKVEDLQWTENKGYSTKINIGNGEATVVENRHPTWPRRDEDVKRNVLNKSLVVRIGKTDQNTKHVICSKTTMNPNQNGTTTTTKITIDLNPSPTTAQPIGGFTTIPTIHKFPNQMSSTFKSPSLIMNTIKTEFHSNASAFVSERPVGGSNSKIKIPQQLEALRRLYEDVQSDSEADKEVQSLMSKNLEADKEGDHSSIVSGSWSKVTAFNHLTQFNSYTANSALIQNALIEKVSGLTYSKKTPEQVLITEPESKSKLTVEKSYSPKIIRRSSPIVLNQQGNLKVREQLSSPVLVQPNQIKKNKMFSYQPTDNTTKTTTDKKTATKSVEVLRQPKKSQMAYFGVEVSPTTLRKNKTNTSISQPNKLTEKPDLLQFSSKVDNHTNKSAKTTNFKRNIYENVTDDFDEPNQKYHPVKREFDSKILEELTKAADEILQAVNGYTDEERYNKFSTEEEDGRKFNPDALETISETKSVRNKTQHHQKSTTSSRLKQASSTSSIDSISRECPQINAIHSPRSKSVTSARSVDHKGQRTGKKSPSSVTSDATNKSQSHTKARRLQRASSREALLQSHGSSSEDLAVIVEMPIRKPRVVKRTKITQLTVNNGIEVKRPSPVKETVVRRKADERLMEIRHKTAVSTIRSTAEKVAANRERAKIRNDDVKKKSNNLMKKDHNRGAGVTSPRITGSDPRCTRSSTSREYSSHNGAPYRTVTSSSANAPFMKKPHKSDGLTK